jgi:hypothetical protein
MFCSLSVRLAARRELPLTNQRILVRHSRAVQIVTVCLNQSRARARMAFPVIVYTDNVSFRVARTWSVHRLYAASRFAPILCASLLASTMALRALLEIL